LLWKNRTLESIVSGIFAATRPQFDDRPSFVTLASRNGLEYRNFDFSSLIGNHFSTLRRNLVRFGLVTPGFETYESVRLAWIILLRSLGGGAVRHCGDHNWVCFSSIR